MKIITEIKKLDESIKKTFNNPEQRQLGRVITIVNQEFRENQPLNAQVDRARTMIAHTPRTNKFGSGNIKFSRLVSSQGEKTIPNKLELALKNGEKAQHTALDGLKSFILLNKDLIVSLKECKEEHPEQFNATLQDLPEESAATIKALSEFAFNPILPARPHAAGTPSQSTLAAGILVGQQNATGQLEIPARSNTPTANPIAQNPEPLYLGNSWIFINAE